MIRPRVAGFEVTGDTERLELMRAALDLLPDDFEIHHWDSVCKMRKEFAQWLTSASLISLDYDLSNSRTPNPGDGLDAVNMLNRRKVACPVIVHTSLAAESNVMAKALREHDWTVEQVLFRTRDQAAAWGKLVAELTCLDEPSG